LIFAHQNFELLRRRIAQSHQIALERLRGHLVHGIAVAGRKAMVRSAIPFPADLLLLFRLVGSRRLAGQQIDELVGEQQIALERLAGGMAGEHLEHALHPFPVSDAQFQLNLDDLAGVQAEKVVEMGNFEMLTRNEVDDFWNLFGLNPRTIQAHKPIIQAEAECRNNGFD
jgi:hypothetical protein